MGIPEKHKITNHRTTTMVDKSIINEGLQSGELKGLVDSTIDIDRHRPKVGRDGETVVVALYLKYPQPAEDLANFIQTSELEHLDVESSNSMDDNGNYTVYVEFDRDSDLFIKVNYLLEMVDMVTSEKGHWNFHPLGEPNSLEFNKNSFAKYIITSSQEYDEKYKKRKKKTVEEEIKERIKFMVNY